MTKYTTLEQAVFNIFGSNDWNALGITTVPSNYSGDFGSEFIKINIIPGSSGINLNSTSGQLIIEIYIPAGDGPRRISEIADSLDSFFVGTIKYPSAGQSLQFFNSALGNFEVENPTLYKAQYVVNFNFTEVSL